MSVLAFTRVDIGELFDLYANLLNMFTIYWAGSLDHNHIKKNSRVNPFLDLIDAGTFSHQMT